MTTTAVEPGHRAITDREFAAFQQLVYRHAGISLSDAKRQLLVGRLSRRLRELHLPSFGAYYDLVAQDGEGSSEELVRCLDLICTNETRFFREPSHFEFLAQRVFPLWRAEGDEGRRAKKVRVWSAACSTGQEPYTLAMLLLAHFPASEGWTTEVVATDLSTKALRIAVNATWPIEKAVEIPDAYRKRFMLRGTGAETGMMRAGPELRSIIRFSRLNLNDDAPYGVGEPFDLLFCRNVMMYFTPEGRARVTERLLDHVAPHGYFFVGHAESLHAHRHAVYTVIPTVYSKVRR